MKVGCQHAVTLEKEEEPGHRKNQDGCPQQQTMVGGEQGADQVGRTPAEPSPFPVAKIQRVSIDDFLVIRVGKKAISVAPE